MLLIKTEIGNIAGDYLDCGKEAPLVIIAHGKGGHRNTASKEIAEYLWKFNISSLRIDLYGYGESDGKFEDITITTAKESILGAVEYAKSNLKYSKLFLFGTSYGGSGILGALPSLSSNDVSGLILRCTILNYWEKTLREFSKQELQEWKERGYRNDPEGRLNYSFVDDMKNYINLDYLELTQFNTLYFYAGKDTKVPRSDVDQLKANIPEKFDLVIYSNSAHGIDIKEDFDDMLIRTRKFIERVVQSADWRIFNRRYSWFEFCSLWLYNTDPF